MKTQHLFNTFSTHITLPTFTTAIRVTEYLGVAPASIFEGSTASTVTCSFRSSWRLVLIGVEVWGWSRGAMGIPASIRAAWEKTGALTGRVPLWALAARQNADKMEMSECWVLALSRLRVESE